jgi:hypothetical protein
MVRKKAVAGGRSMASMLARIGRPSTRSSRSATFATASEGSARRSTRQSRAAESPAIEISGTPNDDEEIEEMPDIEIADSQAVARTLEHVAIDVPEGFHRDTYKVLQGENRVVKVLDEEEFDDGLIYTVRFGDTRHEKVSATSVSHHKLNFWMAFRLVTQLYLGYIKASFVSRLVRHTTPLSTSYTASLFV